MQVNISAYSGLVSAGDWAPALIGAWPDIKANGGTIYLDEQEITLKGAHANLIPDTDYEVPLIVRGDGSSRVVADAGTELLFYFGNLTGALFEKFAIVGVDGHAQDCGGAIYGASSDHIQLRDMIIGGISSAGTVVYSGASTSLALDNTRIGGCSAGDAVVKVEGSPKLTMRNGKILDYILFPHVFLSKTWVGTSPAWVKAVSPPTRNGEVYGRVHIQDWHFDEGGATAVWVEDYPDVHLERLGINVCGATVKGGVYLKNVANARILGCNIGYAFTASNLAAVTLENCGNVLIDGLSIDHGVTKVVRDAATTLTLINSPGVLVEVV